MSDWITHLGVAYGPGRLLDRNRVRLVLLGAVLPDATTPFVVAANLVHFHPGDIESYLQPIQAPLPTLLLASSLALLTPTFGRSFLALAFGILTHYVLDLSQIRYGGGIYLRYPLDFWSPSLDLYWPESATSVVLLGLGTLGTVWALSARSPRIPWQGRERRWIPALLPAAAAFLLPLVTLDAFYEANANNVAFYSTPDAFEGREVALAKLVVTRVEPDPNGGHLLTVRKGDRFLTLRAHAFESWGRIGSTPPGISRRVSVRGVYHKGRMEAGEPAHVHFRPIRTWTSLLGMILLAGLVLPESWIRRRKGSRPGRGSTPCT